MDKLPARVRTVSAVDQRPEDVKQTAERRLLSAFWALCYPYKVITCGDGKKEISDDVWKWRPTDPIRLVYARNWIFSDDPKADLSYRLMCEVTGHDAGSGRKKATDVLAERHMIRYNMVLDIITAQRRISKDKKKLVAAIRRIMLRANRELSKLRKAFTWKIVHEQERELALKREQMLREALAMGDEWRDDDEPAQGCDEEKREAVRAHQKRCRKPWYADW